jgi:hypothetical protein
MTEFKLHYIPTNKIKKSDLFTSNEFIEYHIKSSKFEVITVGVSQFDSDLILAYISFLKKDYTYISPITGAYGGPIVLGNNCSHAIKYLLSNIAHFISLSYQIKNISITLPPSNRLDEKYDFNLLFKETGWELLNKDINYYINIDENKTLINYLDKTKRKVIRRIERENMSFKEEPHSNLMNIYEIIKQNRIDNNIPMTMDLDSLADISKYLKHAILLFSINDHDVPISSAICLKINPEYLYVFYWGELTKYRKSSPVTYLAYCLYNYCKKNNIHTLDIGTASKNSILNTGLAEFKRRLGFTVSHKYTYSFQI